MIAKVKGLLGERERDHNYSFISNVVLPISIDGYYTVLPPVSTVSYVDPSIKTLKKQGD